MIPLQRGGDYSMGWFEKDDPRKEGFNDGEKSAKETDKTPVPGDLVKDMTDEAANLLRGREYNEGFHAGKENYYKQKGQDC